MVIQMIRAFGIGTVVDPTGGAELVLPLREAPVTDPHRVQRRLQAVRAAWIVRSVERTLS